jgi:hypothetical protein
MFELANSCGVVEKFLKINWFMEAGMLSLFGFVRK